MEKKKQHSSIFTTFQVCKRFHSVEVLGWFWHQTTRDREVFRQAFVSQQELLIESNWPQQEVFLIYGLLDSIITIRWYKSTVRTLRSVVVSRETKTKGSESPSVMLHCFILFFVFFYLPLSSLTPALSPLSPRPLESDNTLTIKNEKTRSVLLFTNVTEKRFGNYTCFATNRLGASNASMLLFRKFSRRHTTVHVLRLCTCSPNKLTVSCDRGSRSNSRHIITDFHRRIPMTRSVFPSLPCLIFTLHTAQHLLSLPAPPPSPHFRYSPPH